jgi:uncharacterized membrane protein YbhN (UPF0104 family)
MTPVGVVRGAIHLLFAAGGVALFCLGGLGSLRVRRYRVDLTLTLKQRLWCTAMGLLLLAIAVSYFSGWEPGV